jgi:hypothetical protein
LPLPCLFFLLSVSLASLSACLSCLSISPTSIVLPPPPSFSPLCRQAGSLEAVAHDKQRLKEAVVFASACGALTTTKKGAIEGQPKIEECIELYETSKEWYNYW